MMTIAELRYLFTADTKDLDAAYARADAGAEKSAGIAKEAGRQIGGALAGLGLAYTGAEAIKMAANFQTAMTKIQTQAGASSADVKTLSRQILGLGGKVQQSPEQLADAMFHLKSVGMSNVAAMKALKASSDLAAVGGANLEDTVNALAGAWRSGIKGAADFGTTAATVNAIIGAGNMKMSDLTAAMSSGILPAAKTFGVSFKQVGAALALMTDEGVPAQLAATRLRMTLSLMGAPSTTAAKALSAIGLSSDDLADKMRSSGGLVSAVQLLKAKLDDSGLSATRQAQVISRAFGGGESSAAIMTMLNNVGVLKGKFDQINGSVGKFGSAVAAQRQTAQAQFALLKSAAESLGIKLGTSLLPPITKFVTYLTSTVVPEMKKFGKAADDVLGPIAGWLGKEGLLGPLVALAGTLLALKKLGVIKLGVKMDKDPTSVMAASSGGMGKAADTMVGAAASMQRAADTMAAAGSSYRWNMNPGSAGGAAGAAGKTGLKSISAAQITLVGTLTYAAITGLSKIKTPGGGSLLAPKKSDLGVGGNFWKLLFGGGSKPQAAKTGSVFGGPKPLPSATPKSSGILGGDWNAAYQSFFNGFASPIAHWFTSSLPNAVGDIGRFFAGRWDSAYQSFFNGFASPLTHWFTVSLPNFFTSAVPRAFSTLKSGVTNWLHDAGLGQLIVAAFQPETAAVRWLATTGVHLVEGFGNGIATGAKSVGGWLDRDIYKPVTGYFAGAGSWLYGHGKSLVAGIGNGIGAEAKSIGGWLYSDIYRPATGYFAGAGSWLYGHGKSLILGLGHGIGDEARSVGGWLYSDIYRPVTGYFSGAGSWLWNHGRDIVAGLLGGIGAKMRGVGSWIKGTVVDPIINAVKHFFGIHSPSTVFHGLGVHMVTGLMNGLATTDGAQIVKKIFGSMPKAALSMLGGLGSDLGGLLGKLFGGGGSGQYASTILQALKLLGLPAGDLGLVQRQINSESGGRLDAVNNWDINAQEGHPSTGILQLIAGTFARWAGPFKKIGPFLNGVSLNPLAQIYAALNYAMHGRGIGTGPGQLGSGHGYKDGSWSIPATGPAVVHQGEMILPMALASAVRGALGKGGDGASSGDFTGSLYLDSGEFLGAVRGEIRQNDRQTARHARAGTGRRAGR